jgi:HSP20 family molecular chaperone IbpA
MEKKTKTETTEGKEKDLEEMKREIAQKGKEIEQLQKSVEEMKAQIRSKEKTRESAELGRMLDDVSGLLDAGFGIFGASDKPQGENSGGIVGLVNKLSRLSETPQTTQKRINFGKGGVIDFHVSSRPLRDTEAPKPAGTIRIRKPNRIVQETQTTLPSTGRSINEREPMIDVFEEADCLRVTAELCGVEERGINLKVKGKILEINADTSKGKYNRKVQLPYKVDKKIIQFSYRNGILEVKLKKTGKSS